MTDCDNFPLIEDLASDADDIRDLIRTTPLILDDAGLPIGYDMSQLFGLEPLGRF
jgi:hypothetical protein